MLQTIEIVKEYRNKEINSVALSNINLNVDKGEYLTVLGPSGSGKTSLVNILGLLDPPSSGTLIINDQEINSLNDKEKLSIRKKEIGFIFKDAKLIEELTIAENIELPLVYQKIKRKDRNERVSSLLGQMNLLHRKNHYVSSLSSLQKQKVAIARALSYNPSIIIADEPTGLLNSADGDEILDILSNINDNGTSLLVFTHSDRVAERGQRIVQLFDGHLIMDSALK
ncbi:ABC transporter ATP-binding protein [Labilibacter sediminis]|nr:ABC transporter ATP-binding protein [Labilibacter sediminis]